MALRQLAGLGLIVGGGATAAMAGGRYLSGALAQDRARRAWDAAAAHVAVAAAGQRADDVQHRSPVAAGVPVARLIIPTIGLDDIVLEGVDEDVLNGGPGHYPGSAEPGEPGNAIISAHRDRHFRRLGDLTVGDTLRTVSGSRDDWWVVVSRRVVDKNARALFPSTVAALTLTTCWPIQYLGSAPDRLIVTAMPLGRRKG